MQPLHERRHIARWHRREVLDLGNLRRRSQQIVEMAFPARRVIALAETAGSAVIKHRLDALTDARSGFGLRRPDRFEALHDVRGVDPINRQRAERRLGVCFERVRPLLPMFGVAPARAVRCDVLLGRRLERDGASRLGEQCLALLALLGEGIDARPEQFACIAGRLDDVR